MPSFCAVHKCNDKYGHDPTISFHKFPIRHKDLLQQWIAYARRGSDWQPSKWSAICSRHFRDEDFNCVKNRRNLRKAAVPSVPLVQDAAKDSEEDEPSKGNPRETKAFSAQLKETHPWQPVEEPRPDECTKGFEINKRQNVNAQQTASPVVSKIPCRLCGNSSGAVATFATNFEIYGMIQKCLPNLNIQKDDAMPQDMCRVCLKRLESFSRFIDQVMKTQAELQRKLRSERQQPTGRSLNIKQEPVFRVKQEEADAFPDSFLADELDMMTADDMMGEGEGPLALKETVDQKMDFFDFPVLNAQDIVNNCDIMEIVNLDDPFINIPDDDGATTNLDDLPFTPKTPPPRSMSAHDLLQAHMLNEEHNYAMLNNSNGDMHIKSSYKTEKIEGYEHFHDIMKLKKDSLRFHNSPAELMMPPNGEDEVITDGCYDVHEDPVLSTKPIITSVSEIREQTTMAAMTMRPEGNDCAQVTAVDLYDSFSSPLNKQYNPNNSKSNVVVLNESIVQSSSAFKLLACAVCQVKFVSMQSLRQHEYQMGHGPQMPMVSVPPQNVENYTTESLVPANGIESHNQAAGPNSQQQGQYMMHPEATMHMPHSSMDYHRPDTGYELHSNAISHHPVPTVERKPQINILEMQQTFINHMDIFGRQFPGKQQQIPQMLERPVVEEVIFKVPDQPPPQTAPPPEPTKHEKIQKPAYHLPAKHLPRLQPPVNATSMNLGKLWRNPRRTPSATGATTLQTVTQKYAQLQRSFQQLQQRFNRLCPTRYKTKRLHCNICYQGYTSVIRLLQHKQMLLHYVEKPRYFVGSCVGCGKSFRSRLALRNHMRYICQALSLRFIFRSPLKALKCHHCRMVTFTHWRLYRRHEIKCRARRHSRAKPPAKIAAKSGRQDGRYACVKCPKRFPNQNALSQHAITHTQTRKHVCDFCAKEFKRRNGLMQHIRGYHMNLKPHTCPVCQHGYALKCDMLRCRHSVLKQSGGGGKKAK